MTSYDEKSNLRKPLISIITVSVSMLIGIVGYEGYTDTAVIPVKGDVPTIGHGTTVYPDGRPVRMGDKITRRQASEYLIEAVDEFTEQIRSCAGDIQVTQAEFDLLIDHAYQYGSGATCRSSMVRNYRLGQYSQACKAYASFKYVKGRDCSIRSNGCYGVWTRSKDRESKCLAQLPVSERR